MELKTLELQTIDDIDNEIEAILTNIELQTQQVRQLLTLRKKKKTKVESKRKNKKDIDNAKSWYESFIKNNKNGRK